VGAGPGLPGYHETQPFVFDEYACPALPQGVERDSPHLDHWAWLHVSGPSPSGPPWLICRCGVPMGRGTSNDDLRRPDAHSRFIGADATKPSVRQRGIRIVRVANRRSQQGCVVFPGAAAQHALALIGYTVHLSAIGAVIGIGF